MVVVTGTAQHEAWRARVMPPVEKVRPGLWSLPVPMPDSPLRYVLSYAIELPDGIALIDTGWPTRESWDALVAGLAGIGASVGDVRATLITHMHADHHGLSGRVREESGAWIGMHANDADVLKRRVDADALIEQMRDWVVRRGGTADDAVALSGTADERAKYLGLADPDRLIADGDRPLPGLRAVWTPGHTPGHLCFHDETRDVLFTGDHILPRISPNISLHPGQPADPLGDFTESLEKAGALEVDEVLPAHEYRFAGLRDRADALLRHHATRLGEVEELLAARPGATTWAVAEGLTWSRTWPEIQGFIRRSALGETLAHLARLVALGRVVRAEGEVDSWSLTAPRPRATDRA
jgi:glyoxylase-like metal-dependent hydrolase (beta-lactamase superfamily II)